MLTLSEIKNPFVDRDQNQAIREFVGSMISDRGIIRSRQKMFYSDADRHSEDVFRVIDEGFFKKFKPQEYKKFLFEPEGGVIKEFFDNKPFMLEVPVTKGKDITTAFIQHYLGGMAKEKIVDDLHYTIIKNISSLLGVFYDSETKSVGFGRNNSEGKKIKNGNSYSFVKVKEISLEEVVVSEINQGYVNKDIGDPDREFSYAHLLRAHAKFTLFGWARRVILTWKKYNVVATSRWQGKTYLAAKVAARELLKPGTGFGGRKYREIKYFVPDKENVGNQVMQYIESLLGDLVDKKLNWKPVFEIHRSKYEIVCNLTGAVFKIVSLYKILKESGGGDLGTSTGEGIACDVAIVDEACRIPDAFWSSFHQRAAFETETFFLISTINEETPIDHWFYRLLIDGETWLNPNVSSHRVTIDDNEVMKYWRTEEDYKLILNEAKAAMRIKGDKEFYAKGYCIILEESNVFSTGSYIVAPNRSKYADSDPRILGFDLGKLTDTCGLVLINLKHREIEEARKVLNATYGTQLMYAEEYKKKYKNLLVIGDRSGVGEAVSEQDVRFVVDTWIKSTGSGDLKFDRTYKYWTYNKGSIIGSAATAFNTNLLKIPSDLLDLIGQMNKFVKMKSGSGSVILYKGKGKEKDDLVLSMAYAIVYMYNILALKSVAEIESYVSEIWNSLIYSYNEADSNESTYHNWLY